MVKRLGVGVIGMGWMGMAHARAHSQAHSYFPEFNAAAKLIMCADSDARRAKDAQTLCGFKSYSTDWRDLLARADIDIVCVTSPNFLHREMVEAVAAAGKHVMCEKPVGRSPGETLSAATAVANAGVNSAVGYNYRWSPVTRHAAELIKNGDIGKIQVYNGRFFSLYGSDPLGVWSWRYAKELAGSGAIGDLLTHAIDLAHWLNAPITRVNAVTDTFITERPSRAKAGGFHYDIGDESSPKKPVTNEDYVCLLAEYANGSRGILEASRSVYGPKCELKFDIYGDKGAINWNFERMNELQICVKGRADGYTRVLTGVEHPFHSKFNPGDGIAIGYLDLKTIEAAHFLKSVASGEPHAPGMREAAQVANVADAIARSTKSRTWEAVAPND